MIGQAESQWSNENTSLSKRRAVIGQAESYGTVPGHSFLVEILARDKYRRNLASFSGIHSQNLASKD